jgi:hypothetical protein
MNLAFGYMDNCKKLILFVFGAISPEFNTTLMHLEPFISKGYENISKSENTD